MLNHNAYDKNQANKAIVRNGNVIQNIQNKKMTPPPLPPDFALNRSKYINPASIRDNMMMNNFKNNNNN